MDRAAIPEEIKELLDDYSTDVMTGDHNKRMYLYYQLVKSLQKADSVDIIVSFLMESGVKMLLNDLDKETADCLYTAVSTDTGCFAYGNTNAATFDAAAKLAAAGADISALNKLLFRTKRKSRAMLEGSLYSNMRYS